MRISSLFVAGWIGLGLSLIKPETVSSQVLISGRQVVGRQVDAQAVQNLEKEAALGHHEAQYRLGVMYYTGNGVRENLAQARKYLELSAVQGNPDAQFF